MNTCLYIGIYEGRETYIKNGIFTELHSRMKNYSSGGNLMTIHRLCVCIPGLDYKIEALEESGKNHFLPYRMKLNGMDSTEYLQYKTSPKGYTLLTLESVIEWYYNKTKNIKGLFWVKEKYFPITSEDDNLKLLMEKIRNNPKEYLDINS